MNIHISITLEKRHNKPWTWNVISQHAHGVHRDRQLADGTADSEPAAITAATTFLNQIRAARTDTTLDEATTPPPAAPS